MNFAKEPRESYIVFNFSGDEPMAMVSQALRRLWLLQPPVEYEGLSSDQLKAAIGLATKSLAELADPPGASETCDDKSWLESVSAKTLSSPLGPIYKRHGGRSNNALYAPWRLALYDMYKHVFYDAWQRFRHLYEPTRFKIDIRLLVIGSDGFQSTHGRDVFLYPMWITPGGVLKAKLGETEKSWTSDGENRYSLVWVKRQTQFEFKLSGENGSISSKSPVAIVITGHLGGPIADEPSRATILAKKRVVNYAPEMNKEGSPVVDLEMNHLARSIFLQAGDAVERCKFNTVASELLSVPGTVLQPQLAQSGSLYAPLGDNCTRLLILEPGGPQEELRTRLQQIKVRVPTTYEALSYTWGDPNDKVDLSCQGSSRKVPRNLCDALKRLRYHDRPRYLWADSICINQQDLAERSQQVSMMDRIFQNATRVIAWLGQDQDGHAALAFEAVCSIVSWWKPEGDRLKVASYKATLSPVDPEILSHFREAVTPEHWQSLRALFSHTYFKRMWIIQELALGRQIEVYWGEHHISWGLVGVCAAWVLTEGWRFHYGRPLVEAYNALLIYVLPLAQWSAISMFPKLDLSTILGTTMDRFDATDARNHIYALLGIPFSGNKPVLGSFIRPDYTQSVRSVYVEAARCMIQQDGHLRILSAVQHGAEPDGDYPSWVPRWDQPLITEPFAMRQEQGYYANGGELLMLNSSMFGADGESLVVAGLECGSVASISDVIDKINLAWDAMKTADQKRALGKMILMLFDSEKRLRTSWSGGVEEYVMFAYEDPQQQEEAIRENKLTKVSVNGHAGDYSSRSFISSVDGERAADSHLAELLLYWRERVSWDQRELPTKDLAGFWDNAINSDDPHEVERTFERYDDGSLRLDSVAIDEEDLRFQREVGKHGIREFEIR
ncbi:heterokaryon incompatibility protein-domain-containing protein [Stachybotrys elegans]|uniref:Heterokaryon incompatibility protein-domain-containing protein n=1 Tax=Stachybotrys elegans TaxID=80388 RepID=A0A8K0WKI1_9HYPO|nr:heterokaryon incompatibility protein-domain-containing protein [Stachybotrys elegans]